MHALHLNPLKIGACILMDSTCSFMSFRDNKFIVPMVDNPAWLELASKLWVLEDIPRGVESILLACTPATTLATLIRIAASLGKGYMYKRLLSAVDADSDFIAKLLLRRIKKATRALDSGQTAFNLSYHIDLCEQLCLADLFRRSFFDQGMITTVTISFVSLSRIVVDNPTEACIAMLVSCFAFFSRCLEGDDYPSLAHAIKAGFIASFLDCSPAFEHMPEDNTEIAMDILRRVLPRYLVYRSFIEAVITAVEKLNTPHYRALIAQPLIQPAWKSFSDQLAKRRRLLEQAKDDKREGTRVKCDNIMCGKIDFKREFKYCSACNVVCYCSPECQKRERKASHKIKCPQIQAERAGNRAKGRPKEDLPFAHAIAASDADINFAFFHDLAARRYPNTPRSRLMLCIDYTVVPEIYSIKLIEPGASGHPGVSFPAEERVIMEQQFQAFVTKMRANPDATIAQSILASGSTVEILLTPIARENFWTDKNTYSSDSEDSDDWEDAD
ncbi:hypothetical protein B0H19DRAFT_91357 [Mycena capillaripes]|nr:hypothetical protein B0H19DRAFT_91357 [Mycena capillaripes]